MMDKMPPESYKPNLALLVTSLIIVLIILELAVRVHDATRGLGFFSDHRNLIQQTLTPLVPFRTFGFKLYDKVGNRKHILSRHGEVYPLGKPSGSFRIVVFGGSTSENEYSYNKERIHYPLLLQSFLRESLKSDSIEVINVANSGYSTAHSLILFELDVISWNPDLVIVSHNINDLLTAYWPDFTFDYSNKYSHEFYSIPAPRSTYTTLNWLFQHSQLYWFVRHRISAIGSAERQQMRRRHYDEGSLRLPLRVFERNLRTFVAIARAHGIRVLLGNQPLQKSEDYFVRHMGVKPYNSIIEYPLHDEFVHHHGLFNEAIERVATKEGELFLDNDSLLSGKEDYFIDYIHYTPTGVRKLANNYTRFLLDRGVIDMSR